jgi:putative salt-induced outer membrane protein YdiY
MRAFRTALFLGLAAILAAANAGAGTIYLKSGDEITGEITRIWDEEITIEPDYANDKFRVEIDTVAYIKDELEFEIELEDGREGVATLSGGSLEGGQQIIFDGETLNIGLDQIFELDEVEDWFDNENHIAFAAEVEKGNTDKENFRLSGDTLWKFGDHRHFADASLIREETDGHKAKEQDLVHYNYNWLFSDPVFLGLTGNWERDPFRDLDYRYIASVTLGRDLFRTPSHFLNVQIGPGYQKEDLGGKIEDHTIGYWALRYKQEIISDLDVFHNHSVYTNLSGRKNTVIKSSSGVNFEITDFVYVSVEFLYDWESHPAPDQKKKDTTLLVGLGVEF